MGQIRNITPYELFVPVLRKTVAPDELVSVPDELVASFACQKETWRDDSKRKKEDS